MTGFGLAHIRKEGAPMHPDDIGSPLSDGQYIEQLKAYAGWRGVEETKKEGCVRGDFLNHL